MLAALQDRASGTAADDDEEMDVKNADGTAANVVRPSSLTS